MTKHLYSSRIPAGGASPSSQATSPAARRLHLPPPAGAYPHLVPGSGADGAAASFNENHQNSYPSTQQ